jgi:hypothetical protein
MKCGRVMSKENIPEECDYCEYLAKDLYMENFINGPSNLWLCPYCAYGDSSGGRNEVVKSMARMLNEFEARLKIKKEIFGEDE